ncbi:hypothetical protein [Rodentibacter trehalosifermentans]|uniref:hypothetical protein n=1 Tax=Rodentibacter trehalosifermentans TaxID=1908263 RepID=UPI0009879310|nr:hypothetical protein [Rodentibacter trehalosifermentans]OOF52560.1 hypothetical protein BKK53_04765 [Rodentibacter trehalosifermentans]
MATVVNVKIKDLGLADEIKFAQELDGAQIKIGIQADEKGEYENGASVLDVAAWNEFGTNKIPSRPFIRQCFSDNLPALEKGLRIVAVKVLNGEEPKIALSQLGQWYQDKQKECLLHFPWKPNAASTVKAKGSSKPLVDTSQLVNSIRYKVETNAK